VFLRVRDIGAVRIIQPSDTVDSGVVVTPMAKVGNFGNAVETFSVSLWIGGSYSDDTSTTLAPGESADVQFSDWMPEVGTYIVRCSTMLTGDMDLANDRVIDTVVGVGTGVAEVSALPTAFSLIGPRPNPVRGVTSVRYALPERAEVKLTICSPVGALVRTLVAGTRSPGYYRATWDGCDERGRKMPDGLYFCRLVAGSFRSERKLILAR
jgi:hypothetical protein